MIKSFEINNFKSYKQLVSPELSRLTLVGGMNNVGKTTLLEALFLFYDRLNPNLFLRQYNWRGISELALNPESMFSPVFNNFNFDNDIFIKVSNERGETESMTICAKKDAVTQIVIPNDITNKIPQIRTDSEAQSSFIIDIQYQKSGKSQGQKVELIVNPQGLSMKAENASNASTQATFLSAKNNTNATENATRYGQLDIEGKAEPIVEFLRIVEPKLKSISSITVSENMSMLYGDIGLGRKIPISYMGDGISRLLTIILSIASCKNGVVFVDEIENGVHHSIMSNIWSSIAKAAEEYNCQVIATTHSYENLQSAVKGIPQNMQKDFSYLRLEKKENKILAKSSNYEVLSSALNRGWEVR